MRYFNIIAYLAMVIMNYLAVSLPLNGKTTGELAAIHPTLFTPAGVTFSIWSVIYLLLLIFLVLQFYNHQNNLEKTIGWNFAISSLFNIGWLFAWHYQFIGLSVLIMIGLLFFLIRLNRNLTTSRNILFKATFGIYLGWICVATIANVAVYLVSSGWNRFGLPEEIWTMIMIAVATIIIIASVLKWKNPFLAFSVIWALFGIILARRDEYPEIVYLSVAAITILFVVILISFYSLFFKKKLV